VIRFAVFALLASVLTCTGCKKPPDDKTLAQGEWMVVAVDSSDDLTGDQRRDLDALKEFSVVVQGDRATISHATQVGDIAADFTLDQTKMPREIDLDNFTVVMRGREQKMPGNGRGIYTLTGDELVLALSFSEEENLPRPTEFKALADKANHRGVLVFQLKKRK
jgi:uncharacterized protein (TIGR03067 family)